MSFFLAGSAASTEGGQVAALRTLSWLRPCAGKRAWPICPTWPCSSGCGNPANGLRPLRGTVPGAWDRGFQERRLSCRLLGSVNLRSAFLTATRSGSAATAFLHVAAGGGYVGAREHRAAAGNFLATWKRCRWELESPASVRCARPTKLEVAHARSAGRLSCVRHRFHNLPSGGIPSGRGAGVVPPALASRTGLQALQVPGPARAPAEAR